MLKIKGCSPDSIAMLLLFICCFTTTGTLASTQAENIHAEAGKLDFSLPGVDGQTYQLSQQRGKVVLVTFWASWCPQCIEEMPEMDAMWRAADKTKFRVLAINVGEDADKVLKFRQRLGLSFPLLLDREMAIYRKWPLLGLPTSFLINQQGVAVYKAVGYVDWNNARIKARIEALLQPEHETPLTVLKDS